MQYRPLGNTGWNVSTLSFGGSSLGGVFKPIDEEQGIAAVHTAIAHGINLIDVAPFYGLTKAEAVLGKALKDLPRDSYYLSTKCGRYGQADFDFSAARIIRSINESLTRLGVEHVDVLLAHDIEFGHHEQIISETIPALQRLKEQGKARTIGFSGLPIETLRRTANALPDGAVDIVLSYCHYTLNDTALLSLLPELEARGIGVINASPLCMGLLAPGPLPDWHPAPAALRAACDKAAAFCESQGQSLVKLAIQFAAAEPTIPTTLVGTADPAEIRRNIKYLDEPIDQALLAQVQQILEPVHNMTWPSGLPKNS